MTTVSNIKVGKPQTTPTAASHTSGIHEGNTGPIEKNPGIHATGESGAGRPTGTGTARRSTGINPGPKNPIDPRMPSFSPA